jgi:hypothetical protein
LDFINPLKNPEEKISEKHIPKTGVYNDRVYHGLPHQASHGFLKK